MNGIEKLKKIIEVRISSINNTINKYNLLSSLETYAIKLDEENLWDLTEEEAKYIINSLKNISKLTSAEEKFLLDFVKLPPEVKKVKKTYVGLDEKQLSIFNGIKNKILNYKEDNLKKDIDRLNDILTEYKNLLSKLSGQNNMFLITETNVISELLTQENTSLEEQMEIFLEINKLNEKIFANYGLKDDYNEEEIDEDSLGITDLSEEKLDELFKNYGIVWESVSLLSGESKLDKITQSKLYWKELFHEGFIRLRTGPFPNEMLNYGYTVLRAAVARSLMGSGLLPAIGIFHKNRYNAFPLADDVMEPYRPYVDEIVFNLYANGENILNKYSKSVILKLLYADTFFENVSRPLDIGLSITTASLAKCYNGSQKKILYPILK